MSEQSVRLGPREKQIVELLLQGCDNAEIAKQLKMARRTVKAHFNGFSPFRNHRRNQASKTRNTLISEAVMFPYERYGNRIPSEREHRVIELVAQG